VKRRGFIRGRSSSRPPMQSAIYGQEFLACWRRFTPSGEQYALVCKKYLPSGGIYLPSCSMLFSPTNVLLRSTVNKQALPLLAIARRDPSPLMTMDLGMPLSLKGTYSRIFFVKFNGTFRFRKLVHPPFFTPALITMPV
jgi:hypothetical protein